MEVKSVALPAAYMDATTLGRKNRIRGNMNMKRV